MSAQKEKSRLQVCRLPKPYRVMYKIEPKDEDEGLSSILATSDVLKDKYGLSASSVKRLKEGASVTINDKPYKVEQCLRHMCRYLNEKDNTCSLPDPTKCKGCTVVQGADSLDSAINLDASKIDLTTLHYLQEAGEKLESYLQFDDAKVAEVCKLIDAFLEKYSPGNNLTQEDLGYPLPDDIRIDENPPIVWKDSVDYETSEVTSTQIGVLKANLDHPQTIAEDMVYLAALYGNISEALAHVGFLKSSAETNTKTTKAELRLQAISLIERQVLNTKDTVDNVDALVRGSSHYTEAKNLEARAYKMYNSMWGYKSSIDNLIKTLQGTLSILGSEKYHAQRHSD